MKRRSKFTAAAVLIVFIISLSLNIVHAVNQGAEPGSDLDPIVSKSYVDAAISQLASRIQLLLEQNDTLKSQNNQLASKLAAQEQTIKTLQAEMDSVKTGIASSTSTTASGTPASGGTGTAATKPPAALGTGTVNTAVLNLRSNPNTTSAIVAKLVLNEKVTLVSKSGDWYKITTGKGKTGFVMAKFITIKK